MSFQRLCLVTTLTKDVYRVKRNIGKMHSGRESKLHYHIEIHLFPAKFFKVSTPSYTTFDHVPR